MIERFRARIPFEIRFERLKSLTEFRGCREIINKHRRWNYGVSLILFHFACKWAIARGISVDFVHYSSMSLARLEARLAEALESSCCCSLRLDPRIHLFPYVYSFLEWLMSRMETVDSLYRNQRWKQWTRVGRTLAKLIRGDIWWKDTKTTS